MPKFEELYQYHAFSKAPASSGLAVGQSVNKAGHTVVAKDVWADEIPYMYNVAATSELPTTANLNDLAYVGSDKTYYQFNGSNWKNITSSIESENLPNASGKDVLKFYKGNLTPLDNDNNANTTSNFEAYRFFIGNSPIQRFVAATDNINSKGYPSQGYNVIIIRDGVSTLLDGEDCYVDYYGGTIYFTSRQSSVFEISLFTYIGSTLDKVISDGGIEGGSNSGTNVSNSNLSFYDTRGANKTSKDIWGTNVKTVTSTDKTKVYVNHNWTSSTNLPDGWNNNIATVVYNKAFSSDGKVVCNVESNTIKNGDKMFENGPLTYFVDKMDNLESGVNMFANSKLDTFEASMSKLMDASNMFKGTKITAFNGNIPSLVIGDGMFENCEKLNSFKANTRNIHSAKRMFANTPIISFKASLPYMYDGTEMFADSMITNLNTSFVSLLDGTGMFENTRLSFYAVDKIAKTLPLINNYVTNSEGETIMQWEDGGWIEYNRKVWTDYIRDMIYTVERLNINPETIGEIMITWRDSGYLSENEKATIVYELFELMNLKGWTVISNLVPPLEEEPTSIYARAFEVDSKEKATHTNKEGKFIKLRTAPYVYYPVVGFKKRLWTNYQSVSDAENALELTKINA
jgi:hypothetical protein